MAVGRPKRLLCLPRLTPMSDGPQTTPGMSEATWRPGWLICIHIAPPPDLPASAQSVNGPSGAYSSSTTPAGPVSASAWTMTLPVISSPVPPAAHCRYSVNSFSSGTWPSPAMFSSIAAFAIRFFSTCPERRCSGENSSPVMSILSSS